MNRSKLILTILSIFWSCSGFAKIEILFHPTDPTLPKIAEWIQQAQHTIDIAMYDLEVGPSSEVMVALADPTIQARIISGELSIRFIYEGYGTPEQNAAKMQKLESYGADVRFVTSSKKVHHKFAVIDSATPSSRVIDGSANWSISSYRNYDENILFFDQENAATADFESEFERLWTHSTEFGNQFTHPEVPMPSSEPTPEIKSYFNSPRHILKDQSPEHNITEQIINLINQAKTSIEIATTRARSVKILEALKAAGLRGVKIKLLISQDDYHDLWKRSQWVLNQPNIELRIKLYNLKTGNFMTYQMHNKFMIVDQQSVLTGSFNWSDSSENSFIENIVVLSGAKGSEVLPQFTSRFNILWENGRQGLTQFKEELLLDKANHVVPLCGFPAISMSYLEAKEILKLAPKCQSSVIVKPDEESEAPQ